MRQRSIFLVLVLVSMLTIFVGDASARRRRGRGGYLRQGMNEVNIAGDIQVLSADGETETTIILSGLYGRFLTNIIEVGGAFSYTKYESYDAFGSVYGQAAYHLMASQNRPVVPYVAARVGAGYGYDENPILFGGGLGVKAFVSEKSAFTSELLYERQIFDTIDVNNFGLRVGVSLFF